MCSIPACICGFIAGDSRPVECGSGVFIRYIHILPIDFCSNDRISNTIRQKITIAEFELQRRCTAFVKSILNAIRRITFHNHLLQPASGFPFVLAFAVVQRITDCIVKLGKIAKILNKAKNGQNRSSDRKILYSFVIAFTVYH